jgi:hypothetical protein
LAAQGFFAAHGFLAAQGFIPFTAHGFLVCAIAPGAPAMTTRPITATLLATSRFIHLTSSLESNSYRFLSLKTSQAPGIFQRSSRNIRPSSRVSSYVAAKRLLLRDAPSLPDLAPRFRGAPPAMPDSLALVTIGNEEVP